jgi:aspartate kinase
MDAHQEEMINPQGTLVMKFGGSSVGGSGALRNAHAIVSGEYSRWENLAVVVSAMGGTTDALIECARSAFSGNLDASLVIISELKRKHQQAINELFSDSERQQEIREELDGLFASLEALCGGIHIMGELTPRGMDAVVSHGERLMARLFSALLQQNGIPAEAVDANRLIVTDDSFQNARPLMEKTCQKVNDVIPSLFSRRVVPVVTGFIAATEEGITSTLGRGGSDFTAALLGHCINADEVWTWTDVDGVMSADPRIVPEARVIPRITYNEVSEMAYFGAKVLHPSTMRPVVDKNITVWVKNTFNANHPGTCIHNEPVNSQGQVTAITLIRGLCLVNVEGRGMLGVPGIAARTFSAVARQKASVLMISQSSSEQSICFVIPAEMMENVIHAIEDEMAFELARKDIDRVWAQPDVAIVTAIGESMRRTPGVSARLFGVLGREKINVIAIAQGSSEYSISIVLDESDAGRAVREIHDEVIINGS